MKQILQAATCVSQALELKGIDHCFIGGVAASFWGAMRTFSNLDVLAWTGFGNEHHMVSAILARGAIGAPVPNRIRNIRSRHPYSHAHAVHHRVLRCIAVDQFPLNIGLAAFPYEERTLARAIKTELIDGMILPLAAPEDVIVQKVLAGREKDWRDIEGILVRSAPALAWNLIEMELSPLLTGIGKPYRYAQLIALRDAVNEAGDNFPLTPDDLKLLAEPDRPD